MLHRGIASETNKSANLGQQVSCLQVALVCTQEGRPADRNMSMFRDRSMSTWKLVRITEGLVQKWVVTAQEERAY